MYASMEACDWDTDMSEAYGYIYRFPRCDATVLRGLIARHIVRGTAFEGTTVELRPPQSFANADDQQVLSLDGDFGHAYTSSAEVRWRQREPELFDVLLLIELPIEAASEHVVEEIVGPWRLRQPSQALLFMTTSEDTSRLPYVEYHAPNGAVQFVRYVERKTS